MKQLGITTCIVLASSVITKNVFLFQLGLLYYIVLIRSTKR